MIQLCLHGEVTIGAGVDGEVSRFVGDLKLRLDLGRHPGQDGPEGHVGSIVGDGEATGWERWGDDTESQWIVYVGFRLSLQHRGSNTGSRAIFMGPGSSPLSFFPPPLWLSVPPSAVMEGGEEESFFSSLTSWLVSGNNFFLSVCSLSPIPNWQPNH